MDWILDHLQLVFVVVLLGAYALRALMQRREAGEDPARPERPGQGDPEESDRTRRIQEEIRRRILERQRSAPQREPGPVIIFDDETLRPELHQPPVLRPRPVVAPPPIPQFPHEDPVLAAVLDRQRSLEEQMQELRSKRAYALESARPVISPSAVRGPASVAVRTLRRELRRDLRGARSFRKAVLLREILGDPPGLRPRGNQIPRQ